MQGPEALWALTTPSEPGLHHVPCLSLNLAASRSLSSGVARSQESLTQPLRDFAIVHKNPLFPHSHSPCFSFPRSQFINVCFISHCKPNGKNTSKDPAGTTEVSVGAAPTPPNPRISTLSELCHFPDGCQEQESRHCFNKKFINCSTDDASNGTSMAK
jgi:hypothetical protein